MSLTTLLSVQLRPDRSLEYTELIGQLAAKAVASNEAFRWTAHVQAFGDLNTIHFASAAETYAEIGARGNTQELILRVLGEKEGLEWFAKSSACVTAMEQVVLMDRPDLSYQPPEGPSPIAVVTRARARGGHREALEELIRKTAEAVPKTGDPRHIASYQEAIGQLGRYWVVNPVQSLDELDQMLPPEELLTQAFGSAEGGLIFRAGIEAIEEARREIVVLREDLSNVESA